MKTVWTVAMDRRLAELHGTGMPFKIIATKMNVEFKAELTRNAVIGRAHRLVMALRQEPTRAGKKRKRKPRKTLAPAEAPPIAPPEPVIPGALNISQLTHDTCHWPEGDRPPYTYCGEPVVGGGSFCREHRKRAYTKTRAL